MEKNRQISVANITFKLLKRNIKLLGVGKGILKIENSLHLKAVRKTSPWFPAAAKAAELTSMTVSEREASCSIFSTFGLQLTMYTDVCCWAIYPTPSSPPAQIWRGGSTLGIVCRPLCKCQTESIQALPVWLVRPLACVPYHV